MNYYGKRVVSLILVIVTICIMSIPAIAASPLDPDSPQASYYISSVSASASGGSSSVSVYFSILGTGKMTSLGSNRIVLYTSSGSYVSQKTYYYYPNMMGYNKSYHSDTETFSGLSAGTYYAVVYYKASNSSGSDTTTCTTSYAYVTG